MLISLNALIRAGAGNVRPAAEVDKFPGGVEGDHRLFGLFFHQLALQRLAPVAVKIQRLGLGQQLALVGYVAPGDLMHPFLNECQVVLGEGLFAQEFVKETVIDGRPDAKLAVSG